MSPFNRPFMNHISLLILLLIPYTKGFYDFNVVSGSYTFKCPVRLLSSTLKQQSITHTPHNPLTLKPNTNYINPAILSSYPEAFLPPLPRPTGVPADSPPPSDVLQIPNFLSEAECLALIRLGEEASRAEGSECEEYLNARVNVEVSETGRSKEAEGLIDDHLSGAALGGEGAIDETAGGGYRVRLREDDVRRQVRGGKIKRTHLRFSLLLPL